MATTAPHGGEDSDAYAHGGDVSSRASQWPCPQPPTTASARWRLERCITATGTEDGQGRGCAPRSTERPFTRAARKPGLFRLFEEELSGARPSPLVEVRPQGRVQRHTVEHIVDVLPFVQILDVPVPQMGDQLVAVLKSYDFLVPGQVTAVPNIIPLFSHASFGAGNGKRSWWKCRLSCLVRRSSSTLPSRSLTFQFRMVVGEVGGGLQSFLPVQNSAAPSQQIVDIPVRSGGLQGFRPGQVSIASSSISHPAG